jgi:cell wall-associated NlpC family hydrolase
MTADPRNLLARADLADERLEGLVRADRFAAVRPMRCVGASAGIHRRPEAGSERRDELLYGEGFDVLEARDGWAWGQARRDGYVGFVRTGSLAAVGEAPTHRVAALRTAGFSKPDLKSEVICLLSMNSLLRAGESRGDYVEAGEAGWIFAAHLAPIGVFETDYVAVAERYLGAPYLWGGRSSLGLDCSGLVQAGMQATGRACPRDSDQQSAGFPVSPARADMARGDLAFWKGHVGIMLDRDRMVHANGHHMAVAVEPLDEALARIERAGVPFLGYRRP